MAKPKSPHDLVDDTFVSPQSNGARFLEILASLSTELSAAKWKEIQEKRATNDRKKILIQTALTLNSSSQQGTLFRKARDADGTLISIWHAQVLTRANEIYLMRKPKKFSSLDLSDLRSIVTQSVSIDSVRKISDVLLNEHGVILVLEEGYAGMKLDGVATRLASGNPIIALSLRYPRYNNFWFTLMHELSHVALHYDLLEAGIFDDLDDDNASDIEVEANRFAADSIIPRNLFNKSAALRSTDEAHVFALAAQAGVHPALVAGALQHQRKNFRLYSDIVNAIDVREILGIQG